jgi:prepilin-type N-terminal cleavage/methylation domain-containing protein
MPLPADKAPASFGPAREPRSGGFSLLEVLVSLVLFSVTSLVIFSSLLQYARLSERIEAAALTSSQWQIRFGTFAYLVEGIVAPWPDLPQEAFSGDASGFSALSGHHLTASGRGLRPVQLVLSEDRTELVARQAGAVITLHEFSEPAAFSYLGPAGTWTDRWPPETPQDFGEFDDTIFYTAWPLPRAVRITTETGADLGWMARLSWRSPPLFRDQDLNLDE